MEQSNKRIPVVILCGGQGTRIRDVSELIPKPMLLIGGKPILWHIMKIYASQGFHEFILCLGYKGWLIKEFFLNYAAMTSDITVDLGKRHEVHFHGDPADADWKVTLVDTGENAQTGCRLWRARRHLADCDNFMLTYGDGVADLSLSELLSLHQRIGSVGTITGVHLQGRFGELKTRGNLVEEFHEKPPRSLGRINGGFMAFDNAAIWDHLRDDEGLALETVLTQLSRQSLLGVYPHEGYWQSMDTPREYILLNDLWKSGAAPWKTWT